MTGNPLYARRTGSLMFLSCDLVGSTQYKQTREEWPSKFLAFYREFPQALADVNKASDHQVSYWLWKAIGDELIFACVVDSEKDVHYAVRTWVAAMERYELESLRQEGLATKGGAFIATFPGPDSQVSIPLSPESETSDAGVVELNDEAYAEFQSDKYLYDFLGPSVDTGFRVLGSCNQRLFTMSVEVTWAFCRAAQDLNLESETGDVILVDTKELKGVWGGRSYPVFAIDRQHSDTVHVALRRLNGQMPALTDIIAVCSECASSEGWPSRLHLPESNLPSFQLVPGDVLASARTNAMEGAETVPDEAAISASGRKRVLKLDELIALLETSGSKAAEPSHD